MFDRLKEGLVKDGIVGIVEEKLGDRAENIRIEGGSLKADPTDEFIQEVGSEEEADERIEEEAKEAVEQFTDDLASASVNRNKLSKEESEEFRGKIEEELE